MQQEINQTWFFNRTPQEVWEYLIKPKLIELWLERTDFKPIVGHHFHFTSPYGHDAHCEVLEVNPQTQLSYSWEKNSAIDNKPFQSKVDWTLVPKDNGTELNLVHSGFPSSEDFVEHNNGWNICLKLLEDLINVN